MLPVRTRTWGLAAATACLITAMQGTAAAATQGTATSLGSKTVRLSNERTVTVWAHPLVGAAVRSGPDVDRRRVAALRLLTEDGRPEVYVVLTRRTTASDEWLRIRIPGRPNGRKGWVRRDSLGPLRSNHRRLVVDRRTLHVKLYNSGHLIFHARVGTGKRTTPTPGGRYWIREKLKFGRSALYGRYALGTSAYAPSLSEWPGGGVIGIHGTSEPELIPGRPSHGCVRVRNRAMARLWRLTPIGTPLWIR